ncbi:MAG: hypothetical protein HYS75_06910 [Nitrosopumilales archaeon]|nr:hypothetical protein [Nitrosopumilales archaeon]
MKKKTLKDAEGNDIDVEEYESFSMKDLTADPEEIIRRADLEEEDDKRLDELAIKITPLYDQAKDTERATNYWNIGKVINDFDRKLPRRDRRERWLMKSNILERLAQKIGRKGLSKRHLEEMIYFNQHWKIEEIDTKIPWSFYAELAIKSNQLHKNSMRALEKLVSNGNITDHKKLRDEIGRILRR